MDQLVSSQGPDKKTVNQFRIQTRMQKYKEENINIKILVTKKHKIKKKQWQYNSGTVHSEQQDEKHCDWDRQQVISVII